MTTRRILTLTVFILFLNVFFFNVLSGLGLAALIVGTMAFCVLYFLPESMTHKLPVYVGGLATVGFALGVVARDNETTNVVLVLASLATLLSVFYLLVNKMDGFKGLSEVILLPLRTFIGYVKAIIPGFKLLATSQDSGAVKQKLGKLPVQSLLLGVIISLPIVVVLFLLLSGADPIFKQVVERSLSQGLIEDIINHVFVSFVVLAFLLPLLAIHYKPFRSPAAFLYRRNLVTEYSVVMTFVAIVLALFVALQWQYIFIPSVKGVDLSQYGFDTYSKYVQKGFNEFIITSGFVLSLLWTGLLTLRASDRPRKTYLFGAQLVVLAEFAIILASFFRRIWLYQYFHGMTLVRFYGGFVVVLIALMTLTLLGRHLLKKPWTSIEMVLLLAAVAVFGFTNIEKYIAQHPPTVNERVDYTYLSRMSADGYEGWKKAYDWENEVHTRLHQKSARLSKDDLRELAYAGLIQRQLLAHRHDLTMRYGTDQEKREYLETVLNHSIDRINQRILVIDEMRNTYEGYAETFTIDGQQFHKSQLLGTLGSNKEKLTTLKSRLEDTKNNLSKPLKEQKQFIQIQSRRSWFYLSDTFSWTETCRQLVTCMYDVYELGSSSAPIPTTWYQLEEDTRSEQTTLDKLLTYNISEEKAYHRMRADLPLNTILDLQKAHFEIIERETRAVDATESLTFDADISLNTPFLPAVR